MVMFAIYRIAGFTEKDTRRKSKRWYVGAVKLRRGETAEEAVARRAREHAAKGKQCAAFLKCVPKLEKPELLASASSPREAAELELAWTIWTIRSVNSLARVRGACFVRPKLKKWTEQERRAAQRLRGTLPAEGEEERAREVIAQERGAAVVRHLRGECWHCGAKDHSVKQCPELGDDESTTAKPTTTAPRGLAPKSSTRGQPKARVVRSPRLRILRTLAKYKEYNKGTKGKTRMKTHKATQKYRETAQKYEKKPERREATRARACTKGGRECNAVRQQQWRDRQRALKKAAGR